MPRVKEYVSQVESTAGIPTREARPTDVGGTGVSELGQSFQSVGSNLGQIQRITLHNKSRKEVTDADIDLAKTNASLTVQLNDMVRNWKPGDGDITSTFGDIVRQRLDTLNANSDGSSRFETPAGQERFDAKAAAIASQFVVESAKAQSTLDGIQAVSAHHELVDVESNLLQLHPAFFDSTREELAQTINNPDGVYARIPALKRQELIRQGTEALAIAAIEGTIRQKPLLALDQLHKGWMNSYVPNDKMPELIKKAEIAVHALSVDKDRVHKEAEWQRQENARAVENTLFSKLAAHDADPKNNPSLTAQDVLDSNLGEYDPVKMGSIISVLHARSRERLEPQVTDPTVMRTLFERIHLADNDPRKIHDETPLNDAYGVRGKLSFEDLGHLRKELAESRTPEGAKIGEEKSTFLKGMQSQITKSNMMLGKLDPDGDVNMYKFSYMVDRKVEEYRKNGKDPHDLFDPEKPDFLGKPERLKPYQKTLMESIQDTSKRLSEQSKKLPDTLPPEQLRKPGETYQQWRERVIK